MTTQNIGDFPQARKLGIQTLYRYLPYPENDPVRRRWADALLFEGTLYLPAAQEFNDPFDARPTFVPLYVERAKQQYALQKHFRKTIASELALNRPARDAVERRLAMTDPFDQLAALETKWRQKLKSEYRMICLAAEEDNLLMWSHYSGGHTGIVVQFDATHAPWALANRVRYQDAYPAIRIPRDIDNTTLAATCLMVKSKYWEYEKEFRFVNYPTRDAGNERVLDGLFERISESSIRIPLNHIVGVTIGAAMRPALRATLTKRLAKREPAVKICSASIHDREFALHIGATSDSE